MRELWVLAGVIGAFCAFRIPVVDPEPGVLLLPTERELKASMIPDVGVFPGAPLPRKGVEGYGESGGGRSWSVAVFGVSGNLTYGGAGM